MPGFPDRIIGPSQVNASPSTTKFTNVATERVVIQSIILSNPTGAQVTYTCSIGADAAGTRVFDSVPVAAGQTVVLYPREVVKPSEIYADFASSASAIIRTVNADRVLIG